MSRSRVVGGGRAQVARMIAAVLSVLMVASMLSAAPAAAASADTTSQGSVDITVGHDQDLRAVFVDAWGKLFARRGVIGTGWVAPTRLGERDDWSAAALTTAANGDLWIAATKQDGRLFMIRGVPGEGWEPSSQWHQVTGSWSTTFAPAITTRHGSDAVTVAMVSTSGNVSTATIDSNGVSSLRQRSSTGGFRSVTLATARDGDLFMAAVKNDGRGYVRRGVIGSGWDNWIQLPDTWKSDAPIALTSRASQDYLTAALVRADGRILTARVLDDSVDQFRERSGDGFASVSIDVARNGHLWMVAVKDDGHAYAARGVVGQGWQAETDWRQLPSSFSTAAPPSLTDRLDNDRVSFAAVERSGTISTGTLSDSAIHGFQTLVQTTVSAPAKQVLTSPMTAGQTLHRGDRLVSPDNRCRLEVQTDGNLVIYGSNGNVHWASNTTGSTGERLAMQSDGQFVFYGATNQDHAFVAWTHGNPGAQAELGNDCVLRVRKNNTSLWDSLPTGKLPNGTNMLAGDDIISANGMCRTVMQTDGNLVTYGPTGVVWASGSNGAGNRRLHMQTDGNLVIYANTSTPVWDSGTRGAGHLQLSNNCELLIDGSAWSRPEQSESQTVAIPSAEHIRDEFPELLPYVNREPTRPEPPKFGDCSGACDSLRLAMATRLIGVVESSAAWSDVGPVPRGRCSSDLNGRARFAQSLSIDHQIVGDTWSHTNHPHHGSGHRAISYFWINAFSTVEVYEYCSNAWLWEILILGGEESRQLICNATPVADTNLPPMQSCGWTGAWRSGFTSCQTKNVKLWFDRRECTSVAPLRLPR